MTSRPVGSQPQRSTEQDTATMASAGSSTGHADAPVLPQAVTADLRDRWHTLQTRFVDDPEGTVEQADDLVAETIDRITAVFEEQRRDLEGHWRQGEEVSTEQLREAVQRYRTFFESMLTV